MRISLFLLSAGSSVLLCAQDPWARRVGGLSNDGFNAIVVDDAGNSYVTGEFGLTVDAGGSLLTSQGSLDVIVAKYAFGGGLIWAAAYGGPGLDRGIDLALSPDGEVVVTGQFMGTAQFGGQTITSQGGTQDMFVMKVQSGDGDVLWVRQGGGAAGVDQPGGVSVGADGAIAVTGEFRGTASFDMGTITSMIDPNTGQPSVDIFIAAYAGNGDGLWLQQGTAEFADRGIAVVHDAVGNVYVTGQFSDTLLFDVVHNNAMYSAVFLACFDPAGQELWFRVFGGGTYNQVFDVLNVDDARLLLVGDVQGTVIFLDTSPDLFTAVAPRSSFILDVSLQGELNAQTTWGSDHGLNTRAASVLGNEIAVFGRFECQLTGFTAFYGEAAFLATGEHDLYVARFQLSDLAYVDAQQFGGHREKTPGGIDHATDGGLRFCGAFERILVFPCQDVFIIAPVVGGVQTAFTPGTYCGDPNYGEYRALRGSELMDGFLAMGFVAGREPYDVFDRFGTDCVRDLLDVSIQLDGEGVHGPDSLEHCGPGLLQVNSGTAFVADTAFRHNAPDMQYLWNGVLVADTFPFSSSGWYTVQSTSLAGCWTSHDSLYITVHPFPATPLISDDQGVNTNALVAEEIEVCEPVHPWLWSSTLDPANTSTWTGPGQSVENDSIQAMASGWHTITTVTPFGCVRQNEVYVQISPNEPLPALEAVYDLYYPQDTDLDDTVSICMNVPLAWAAIVQIQLNGVPISLPYGIRVLYRCGGPAWSISPDLQIGCSQLISTPGWYQHRLDVALTNAPCGTDTLFFTDTDSIYVIPFPVSYPSADITGPSLICPGDTAVLELSCTLCDQVNWGGPGIVSETDSTAIVTVEGNYYVQVLHMDTNGCNTSATSSHHIEYNPLPLLGYLPPDGIICPDSIALIFSDTQGLSYQWFGPLGPLSVNNDTIITSQQGAYYLEIVDMLGCELTSDPVLITDYATPYLNVLPDGILCEPGETATLQVVTTGASTLMWQPPLSGSALTQVVDEPGLYTCSVHACGIVTELTVEIFGSTAAAELVEPGPFTLCPGETVVLEAVPGQAIYYWLPGPIIATELIVGTSGIWYLVAGDAHGCLDTAAVEVAVIPFTQEISISDEAICIGEPIVFTAVGSGVITWYAGPDMQQVLGTGSILDLGVASAIDTITAFAQQQEGACASLVQQVELIVYAPPGMPSILAPDSACVGSTVQITLDPEPGVQYTWSTPTGTVQGPIILLEPVGMGDAGAYSYVAVNPGCTVTGLPHVLGVVIPEPLELSGDTLICPGGVATFIAPPGFVEPMWNGNAGGLVFSTSLEGAVTLVATDIHGCSSTATALVQVFDFTQSAFAPDVTICLGEDALLTVTGSGSFAWFLDPDLQQLITAGTSLSLQQPLDSVTYYVVQSEDACATAPIAVQLNVVPVPIEVTLQAPASVCAGTPLVLVISSVQPALSGMWQTPTGPFIGDTLDIPQSAVPDEGLYIVVPAIGPCLADTLSAWVNVLVPAILDLGNDTVFCGGTYFELVLPDGFNSPLWSTGNSGDAITTNVPGTFSVDAWDLQGCAVNDAIVLDTLNCGVIVPNIMTPNGDGVNDAWIVGGGGFIRVEAQIYNRWGQIVYEGDPVSNLFKGKHRGTDEPLPDGTYFYILAADRAIGGTVEMTGYVMLQR